jgi:membrane protein DedA with SNARE-associated domain
MAGTWMLVSGLTRFFLDFFLGGDRLLIFSGALSLTQAIDFCLVFIGALMLLEQRSARSAMP